MHSVSGDPDRRICYNRRMAERERRSGGGIRTIPVTLRLVLPLPPGVNNQYATVNGRRVLSAEARRFKAEVARYVTDRLFEAGDSGPLLDALRGSYLSLFIDFYFASPFKRDLDGGLKIAQDALCEALQINDNRVVDIHLVKRIDPRRPRIEVQLETIAEDEWQFDEEYTYSSGPDARGAGTGNTRSEQPLR
jgi:crossover junction endodeoxyribonuclease RusA